MLKDKQIDSEMIIKLNKALANKKITQLQHDVYKFLLTIPAGKVSTYKLISKEVRCNSPRAIGQVLRKNPFAPEVPCHRVVKSNLTLGGFSGSVLNKTVDKKMKLLLSEGVKFHPMKEDQCSEAIVLEAHIWNSKSSD